MFKHNFLFSTLCLDLGPTLHPSCEGSLMVSLLFGWASNARHGSQSLNHPVEDPILIQWALTQSASSSRMQWLEGQLCNYMSDKLWKILILNGWWLTHAAHLEPTLGCRSVLLAWLVIALGATFIVEQPGSSLLARHCRFQQLCACHKALYITPWMIIDYFPSSTRFISGVPEFITQTTATDIPI